MDIELREQPYSEDVERQCLSNAMNDKGSAVKLIEWLEEDDFYIATHRMIFKAVKNLFTKNVEIDLNTVANELKSLGALEDTGGVSYIASLYVSEPKLISGQDEYIDIIKEKSTLRRLIKSSEEIIESCYKQTENVTTIVEKAEKDIFEVTQSKFKKGVESIKEVLSDAMQNILARAQSNGEISGVASGYPDMDNLFFGFQKSDLILIAARPSMGKTAFAMNIAVNAAVKANKKVAVFSLEMSKAQIGQRMLACLGQINMSGIVRGKFNDDEWKRLIKTSNVLSQLPIYVDDTAGINLVELKAKLRRLKIEHGLDLVIIDYLQLMTSGQRNENRVQEISAISRGLKIIAKELDVPVIALSQLSRSLESREDKRPKLSDLRESGAIEQDADIVMFIYREFVYNKESLNPNLAEIIVAKHRNGPLANINLIWQEEYTKFLSMAKNEYEEM